MYLKRFLFLLALFFSFFVYDSKAADDFVWSNCDIQIPVFSSAEDYFYLPTVTYKGISVSYTIGVDGTSKSIVNTECIGHYQVVYQANYQGIISKKKVNFFVYDDIAPSLIFPLEDIVLPVYSAKPDYNVGFLYRDNYYFDYELTVTIDDSNVDLLHIGTYQISYTLVDPCGNQSRFYRNVVIYDDQLPKIEFSSNLISRVGSYNVDYFDGVSIYDNYDEKPIVVVDNSGVDFDSCGVYMVKYTAIDKSGNEAIFYREIHILDMVCPTISLKEYERTVDISFSLSDVYIFNNILDVFDDIDNLDESDVKYISNFKKEIGNYEIIYYVYDSSWNYGEAILKIKVSDLNPPTIEGVSRNIMLGESFDPLTYVKARDDIDGDITNRIIIEFNNVDVHKEGLYKVTYSVYDQGGNYATKDLYFNVTTKHEYHNTTTENQTTMMDIPYEEEKIPEVEHHNSMNQVWYYVGGGIILIGIFLFLFIKGRKRT